MDTENAILFPHCALPPSDLGRILEVFRHVAMGVPWFMDPAATADAGHDGRLKIIRPPQALRPEDDFHRMLAEYQTWMRNHPDRGYNTFFRAFQTHKDDLAAGWTIRQEIRDAGAEASLEISSSFRWHLILHMSTQVEMSGREADALLDDARGQGPILADALEEEPVPDPFFSQPAAGGAYRFLSREQTASTIDAWLGLFAADLPAQTPLLTLNPEVPDLAGDLCEEQGLSLGVSRETPGGAPDTNLSVYTLKTQDPLKETTPPLLAALGRRPLVYLEI